MNNFKTAQDAFEYYYTEINALGKINSTTKYLKNIGFYITEPLNNEIKTDFRKWKKDYAESEWKWYLSENRSVEDLKKLAPIWDKMHNGDNIVNSNYGYQWNRNKQIDFVINELSKNSESRRAVITIYDGKEHDCHSFDTPCTLNIQFDIEHDFLNMSVIMRSNDLWFGFCNDQYCFSKLMELIAKRLNLKVGLYYHFAINLHLYNNKLV